jgi:heptosyltransferase-2
MKYSFRYNNLFKEDRSLRDMKKSKDIIIIKAGYSEFLDKENNSRRVSLGDVLRTTPILHLFKYDNVTWVSDEYAFPLLEKNPYIKRLLPLDFITIEHLKDEKFDIMINLEKTPGIAAVADKIYAVNRFGFRFDPQSRKAEAYGNASGILTVSSDPALKKTNKKTAQELLFEMVGGKWKGEGYVLGYKPKTTEMYDIGLNIFVGPKWPTKTWPTKNWDMLAEMIEEKKLKITRQDKEEVSDDLCKYMDWINSCKMLVTCDSFGMHASLALGKKVLALFGPTPYKEIHFYGRGKAILPEPFPECAPCFKGECEREKSCMYDITVEKVYDELIKIL